MITQIRRISRESDTFGLKFNELKISLVNDEPVIDNLPHGMSQLEALILLSRELKKRPNNRRVHTKALLSKINDKIAKLSPSSSMTIVEKREDLKQYILEQNKIGNIVIMTSDGLMVGKLADILNQPIEGLLYDINRDTGTVMTFLNDPKWINDFALTRVVIELDKVINQNKEA